MAGDVAQMGRRRESAAGRRWVRGEVDEAQLRASNSLEQVRWPAVVPEKLSVRSRSHGGAELRRETHSPAMGLRRSSNGGAALGKVLGKKLDGDWVQGVQGALKGGGDDPRRASCGDCGAGAALRGKRIALTAPRDPGARRVASRRRGEHRATGWWVRRGSG